MFEKIEDFYSQDIRVDLATASMLADLNPQNAIYRFAAARGGFVVSISQGNVHDSVYVSLAEQVFDSISTAQEFVEALRRRHPTATYFNFVAYSAGVAPLPDGKNAGTAKVARNLADSEATADINNI